MLRQSGCGTEPFLSHFPASRRTRDMPSFKAVLNECATREVYLKTCRRIADNEKYTPEFQSDRWVELGRKEKPGLTNAVLEDMFSPETTQYGRYWKTPKLGCEGITLKEPGPGENPEVWQRELVSRVFEQLQSMEATSVVLKCVHPRYFGIYSPVTLTLLQVPLESPRAEIMYLAPVYHYLKCCNEIGDWGAKFLP